MSGDSLPSRSRPNLGVVVQARRVDTSGIDPRRARQVIVLLAACVALMMTGFGIILPVFARRLSELGGGVTALALMTMAFSLAQFIMAPVLGSWADRRGRRPIILLSLFAVIVTNLAYLAAGTVAAFVAVRGLGGAFTAGLFPASAGIVADTMPETERAKWIGILMGGYGAGMIFGPAIGGLLYDAYGFAAPFVISAVLAALAFAAALILIPETRPKSVRRREALRERRRRQNSVAGKKESLWTTLPRPLYILAMLLFIDFAVTFAFAYVEPQMVFYLYDNLHWTTAQFGIVVGAFGLATVFGQTVLGQASDRVGRKPIIVLGILLNATLYAALTWLTGFWLMLAVAAVAGLGLALLSPAISAFYLDITRKEHRSRVIGVKESALALGGILGPLTVALVSRWLSARAVFLSAGSLVLFTAIMALAVLREPSRLAAVERVAVRLTSPDRALVAQSTLRGVVLHAADVRGFRSP